MQAQPLVIDSTNAHEVDAGHFVTDASDLGIPPGVVHRRIATTLGNKQPFILTQYDSMSFQYMQDSGCITLCIYNT